MKDGLMLIAHRWEEGIHRRYILSPATKEQLSLLILAGSALIQACEKAGVVIPRYFINSKALYYALTDKMRIDIVTTSE